MESLNDRAEIAAFLNVDPALYFYEIGDLDPRFWPLTSWFVERDARDRVGAAALLYSGLDPLTLLSFERDDTGLAGTLVAGLSPHLPARFIAHLSPHLVEHVPGSWRPVSRATSLKMVFADRNRLDAVPTAGEPLGSEHLAEINAFYARSYPGNWFDPRMLETDCYHGIRDDGRLVCTAGVHVYSASQRVAALGNIATDPDWRGRGLAQQATAQLCRSLLTTVETVGLNVKAGNPAAIACYRKIGFEVVAEYEEVLFAR